MKKLPLTASDEEVKEVVRHWVALLAEEDYAAAVEMISPEVLPANGSVDFKDAAEWTPELVQAVINHFGTPEPIEGEEHIYTVVPVVVDGDDSLQEDFEKRLQVDRGSFCQFGQEYVGGVHVGLPLAHEEGEWVSDLTARFFLRPLDENEMVLVLEDIHVM